MWYNERRHHHETDSYWLWFVVCGLEFEVRGTTTTPSSRNWFCTIRKKRARFGDDAPCAFSSRAKKPAPVFSPRGVLWKCHDIVTLLWPCTLLLFPFVAADTERTHQRKWNAIFAYSHVRASKNTNQSFMVHQRYLNGHGDVVLGYLCDA